MAPQVFLIPENQPPTTDQNYQFDFEKDMEFRHQASNAVN